MRVKYPVLRYQSGPCPRLNPVKKISLVSNPVLPVATIVGNQVFNLTLGFAWLPIVAKRLEALGKKGPPPQRKNKGKKTRKNKNVQPSHVRLRPKFGFEAAGLPEGRNIAGPWHGVQEGAPTLMCNMGGSSLGNFYAIKPQPPPPQKRERDTPWWSSWCSLPGEHGGTLEKDTPISWRGCLSQRPKT